MDTDDDFMSDAVGTSEDDFLDTQGSDDESMGEGKSLTALLVLCLFFLGLLLRCLAGTCLLGVAGRLHSD
jgi:hypothetical protein